MNMTARPDTVGRRRFVPLEPALSPPARVETLDQLPCPLVGSDCGARDALADELCLRGALARPGELGQIA